MFKPLWPGFEYKSHQTTGIRWMLSREEATPAGGLLCDEMGLGKTIEILGTIAATERMSETLILCPKAVIRQWCDAARKSSFNVIEIGKHGWEEPVNFRSGQPFLFVTNYEKLKNRQGAFARQWTRVVLDEAHRAANKNSINWQSVNTLKRKITWIVTATPIVNSIKDIRNLFGLVGYKIESLKNYQYVCEVVSEACLHRSMDEMRLILKELPGAPCITKEHLNFDSEDEAEFYRGIQGKIAKRWRSLKSDQIKEMLILIMRLRQLSLHPQIYINARRREWAGYDRKDFSRPSTKFAALNKKLSEPTAKPAKWIVFCQFHDEMDMLESYISENPLVARVQKYHGGLSQAEKEGVIEASYQEQEGHDILLLQLQSGGVGLNLQHFTKIIFMSPWWTAALMDQAIGRAVRIGQKEIVEVTHFVLNEEETINIDKKMLDKADEKRDMLKSLFMFASRGCCEKEESESETPVIDLTDD